MNLIFVRELCTNLITVGVANVNFVARKGIARSALVKCLDKRDGVRDVFECVRRAMKRQDEHIGNFSSQSLANSIREGGEIRLVSFAQKCRYLLAAVRAQFSTLRNLPLQRRVGCVLVERDVNAY